MVLADIAVGADTWINFCTLADLPKFVFVRDFMPLLYGGLVDDNPVIFLRYTLQFRHREHT